MPEPGGLGGGLGGELAVEEELEGEAPDRFRTYVALAIAFVSILGAIVAFRASLSEQDAHRADLQGLEDVARAEQIQTSVAATANDDQRTTALYQDHIRLAQLLETDASNATDPTLAAQLLAEAKDERVLARTESRFFQGDAPKDSGDSTQPLTLDRQHEIDQLLGRDDEYGQLHPEQTFQVADKIHTRAVFLLGIVTLFIASLLFLTLAQFTRPAIRRLFAVAGAVVATSALVLWIVTERALAT